MTTTGSTRSAGSCATCADGAAADGTATGTNTATSAATGSAVAAGPGAAAATGITPAASAGAGTGPPYGYVHAGDKDRLINRMRRIEGQTRGIERMIAEDRYCIDILTQIAAATTALQAVAGRILDDHVNHCVRHALASGDEAVAAEKTAELLQAVQRFVRTR